MDNILNTVYDELKEATTEIQKVVTEKNDLEDRVKSNRYSAETVKREFEPRIDDLKQKIRSMKEKTFADAKALVSSYRAEMDERNNLDASELTDDIRLLQSGIPLTERDVEHILRRAENNRTMSIVALRYAEQHGLKIQHRPYTFELEQQAARDTANALDEIIAYFPRWIDTNRAFIMLDQFFGIE